MTTIFPILVILFVLFFFCYCFYKYFCNSENYSSFSTTKIDIVYTWVDNTPEFLRELQTYQTDFTPESHYRDNDELKYSLRSVELFAPWVNHIYIVLKDGQFIPWLDKNNSRITIIYHSQIIPSKYLPTFNSIVIESFLHHIPGLSEYYLYINDDILFWNPILPSDFFTPSGKCIESESSRIEENPFIEISFESDTVNYIPPQKYDFMTMMFWNAKLIESFFNIPVSEQRLVQHVPSPHRKSIQFELDDFLQTISTNPFQNIYEMSNLCKFRSNINVSRISIFKKYFSIFKDMSVIQKGDFNSVMIELTHLHSCESQIRELEHNEVIKYVNIQNNIEYNDIGAETNGLTDLKRIQILLLEKFPKPSSFEQEVLVFS